MKSNVSGQNPRHTAYTLFASGFGGQGVLMIGNLLACAAMLEGKQVSYLPFYGVEMRGGVAYYTLVISSETIGSPVVTKTSSVIAMDEASFIKYESTVRSGGLLLANSSLIDTTKKTRDDIDLLCVPINDIARDKDKPKLANMVALGAFVEKTKIVEVDSLMEALEKVMGERYRSLIPSNMEVIKTGMEFVRLLS
jgi:2-oxoglutarate ferredoxin oxidoreductase subunit gamma